MMKTAKERAGAQQAQQLEMKEKARAGASDPREGKRRDWQLESCREGNDSSAR